MTENEWGIDPTKINLFTDPLNRRFKGTARHGMTDFDVPYMSQIEGNLWMGGCNWKLVLPSEIDNVVSLYPFEKYMESRPLRNFEQIKMYDSEDQSLEQVNEIAAKVNAYCEQGPTLVHCQAGLNRSGVVTARALMLRGWTAEAAISHLRAVRSPACLCNPAFEAWLYEQESLDSEARLLERSSESTVDQ